MSLYDAGPGRFGRQSSSTDVYHTIPYHTMPYHTTGHAMLYHAIGHESPHCHSAIYSPHSTPSTRTQYAVLLYAHAPHATDSLPPLTHKGLLFIYSPPQASQTTTFLSNPECFEYYAAQWLHRIRHADVRACSLGGRVRKESSSIRSKMVCEFRTLPARLRSLELSR